MDITSADAASNASSLRADCGNCLGLCCVVPAFAASADFAIDKPAGQACLNLQPDFRCGIHDRLRPSGFTGCTVFDCFGAGQKVSQVTFAGRSWRGDPQTAAEMFEVFPVVRQLHELLWYLSEALGREAAGPVHAAVRAVLEQVEALTLSSAHTLRQVDVAVLRDQISPLLRRASELIRAGARPERMADHTGADLIGARLKGADLRGAVLRGTYLIGADLRGADLRLADLIGADLRGADLCGADLTGSVFLTQFQLNAAKGDRRTRFPDTLLQPAHWRRS